MRTEKEIFRGLNPTLFHDRNNELVYFHDNEGTHDGGLRWPGFGSSGVENRVCDMEGWRFVNWQEKEHQQAKLAELRGSRESE